MKKIIYPVILKKGEKYIIVSIPDWGIDTQGRDMEEALEMARDAIGLNGIVLKEKGKEFPNPTKLELIETQDGELKTLIDLDFQEYERKNDMRKIKKNCTIPAFLCRTAEKAGINFSATLQEALEIKLNLK